jgi:hypothetical protein
MIFLVLQLALELLSLSKQVLLFVQLAVGLNVLFFFLLFTDFLLKKVTFLQHLCFTFVDSRK